MQSSSIAFLMIITQVLPRMGEGLISMAAHLIAHCNTIIHTIMKGQDIYWQSLVQCFLLPIILSGLISVSTTEERMDTGQFLYGGPQRNTVLPILMFTTTRFM